jgi:protein TonB
VKLRNFTVMQLALGASVAVHAVLITVRFVDPESFNRMFKDTALEVILVNARTNEKPDKAKAIAQHSMAGGGEADAGRATSMLPPTENQEFGDSQETVTANKLQNLQEQQNLLLAEVKNQLATFTPPDPKQTTNQAEQQEREEKRRRLEKLLAEIEKRINAENSRPKKRYVSPATMEAVYALYHDALRRAIEDRGTENFPTSSGKRLYGELTMIVTINHDGRVLSTEVVESSGNPVLDRRAAAIARSAGPFGSFTKAMRREMDQMAVVSRFKFTRDETLEAKVSPGP